MLLLYEYTLFYASTRSEQPQADNLTTLDPWKLYQLQFLFPKKPDNILKVLPYNQIFSILLVRQKEPTNFPNP